MNIKTKLAGIKQTENAFAFGLSYSEVLAIAEQNKVSFFARWLFSERELLRIDIARTKNLTFDSTVSFAGSHARDGRTHDLLSKKVQRTTAADLARSSIEHGFTISLDN